MVKKYAYGIMLGLILMVSIASLILLIWHSRQLAKILQDILILGVMVLR